MVYENLIANGYERPEHGAVSQAPSSMQDVSGSNSATVRRSE